MFHQGSAPRDPIILGPGLNIVQGADKATNSIGKSTVLAMINFAFGGQSWPKSPVTTKYGRHTIGFTFHFGDEDFHFLRIADPEEDAAKYVYPCDKTYTAPEPPLQIQTFRQFLRDKYEIHTPTMSLRDMVGPYVRLAGRDNLTPSRALQQSSSDSPTDAIIRLEKLTGFYSQVEGDHQGFQDSSKKLRAFDRADHEGVFVVQPIKGTEAEAKRREIVQLQRKSEQILRDEDERLLKDDDMITGQNAELRAKIRALQNQQEGVRTQISFLTASHLESTAPSNADWHELAEIFPQINTDRLTQVATFHQRIRANLAAQTEDETLRLQAVDQALTSQIRDLSHQLIKERSSARLPRTLLDQYSQIQVQIRNVDLALRQHERRSELAAQAKQAKEALSQTQAGVLPEIQSLINTRLEELAHALEEANPPKLTFNNYDSYTFNVPGDDGTGTAYTAMVMLDQAILSITELPFLIHDTPVWANISKPRQSRILCYLANMPKQSFFALDATGALSAEAQKVVAAHTVISLDADEESLFGYITNLPADERPTFGIPAHRLPTFHRKRQGKSDSDGQLEFSFDELD